MAQHLVQGRSFRRRTSWPEGSLIKHLTPTALLAALRLDQVPGLAVGDHYEELPEIIAVVKARKASLFGRPAEAVECAQGHIFLVSRPPRRPQQFLTGPGNELP